MTVAEWLKMAKADAERRGGPELAAALEGLATATEALRAADWCRDESSAFADASAEALRAKAEDLPPQ